MEARLLRHYIDIIEGEILHIIKAVALPTVEVLLTASEGNESRAFYLKMKADYKRYLAEIAKGKELDGLLEETRLIYEHAQSECENLFSTHPLRLATALNYSVFLAEETQALSEAVDTAKSAFEAALFDLQALGEDKINETLRVMQLLKDNYTLWELDLRMINQKKRAAGHIITNEDDNGQDDDDDEEDFDGDELIKMKEEDDENLMMLGDDIVPVKRKKTLGASGKDLL